MSCVLLLVVVGLCCYGRCIHSVVTLAAGRKIRWSNGMQIDEINAATNPFGHLVEDPFVIGDVKVRSFRLDTHTMGTVPSTEHQAPRIEQSEII
jgi:hypothetical protein